MRSVIFSLILITIFTCASAQTREETMDSVEGDFLRLQSIFNTESTPTIGTRPQEKLPMWLTGKIISDEPVVVFDDPNLKLPSGLFVDSGTAVIVPTKFRGAAELALSDGKTIGWIDEAKVRTEGSVLGGVMGSAVNYSIEQAIRYVDDMRKKYQNNPYIGVGGFSIHTTPPGVSVDFSFK